MLAVILQRVSSFLIIPGLTTFVVLCCQVAGQAERQEGAFPSLSFMGGSFSTVTSDLGNSSDVIWEQDQAEDGTLVFRQGSTFHTPPSMLHSSRKTHEDRDYDSYHHKAKVIHSDRDPEFYQNQRRGHCHDDQEEDVVQLYREKLEYVGDGVGSDEFEA